MTDITEEKESPQRNTLKALDCMLSNHHSRNKNKHTDIYSEARQTVKSGIKLGLIRFPLSQKSRMEKILNEDKSNSLHKRAKSKQKQ